MKDRFELLGPGPDTLADEWTEDIRNLEERLCEFTDSKSRANAYDIRYGNTIEPEGLEWKMSEKVLARRAVMDILSEGL